MSTTPGTELKVILLHGWGGSAKSLSGLGKSLSKEMQTRGVTTEVLSPDLPGFGVHVIERPWQIRDYVAWLAELIGQVADSGSPSDDRPDAPKVLLIGHSVGAKIIMNYLIQIHGSDLNFGSRSDLTAVLINTSGIKPKLGKKARLLKLITIPYQPLKSLILKLGLGDLEMLIRKFFYKFVVGSRDYEKLRDNKTMRETFQAVINSHISNAELQKIDTRTLILWGEQDKVTPLWMGRQIQANIADSKFEAIAGTRHALPLDKPDLVAAKIAKFILGTN